MREFTKYHDTSKSVKERAKTKVFGAVYSHTAIILLLILLQIGIMVLTFTYLGNYSTYMNGVISLLSFITAIYIFNEKGNPAFKMTWILFVFLVPVVGVGFYLFTKAGIGTKYLGARLEKLRVEIEPYMQQNEYVVHAMKGGRVANANLSHFLYNQVGFPTYGNSQAQYFPLGDDKFPVLIEELNKAEKFIFMEYFIIGEGYVWDTVLEVLRKKVKEGVEIRLMYDGTCSISLLPYEYPKQLREYGIQCKEFGPIVPILSTSQNNRDHRKICVIDGKVAFTGGVNLADEYINKKVRFGHWKDTAIKIEGDAVQSFTMMFLQMWNITERQPEDYAKYLTEKQPGFSRKDGYIIPYGDSPFDHENVGEEVYFHILNHAKKYVHIMTPYLILDNEMIDALTRAGGSTGGTDFIAQYVSSKIHRGIWDYVFFYNCAMIIVFGYLCGWIYAGYSILFQFLSTKTISSLYQRYAQITVEFTTNDPDPLIDAFMATCRHGMSVFECYGAYSHRKYYVCKAVISTYELRDVVDNVRKVDPKVLINTYNTVNFYGNFYQKPLE